MTRRHHAIRLAALAAALLLPRALAAQVIHGRVEADSVPVRYVEVVLADSTGEEVHESTDADGMFRFELGRPGTYTLRARHSDYPPAGPQSIEVGADEEVAVVIRLESPIPLAPIEVTARRPIPRSAALESRAERLAWAEKTGLGRVIDRQQIERMPVSDVRELLRIVPRIQVVQLNGVPQVFIANGTGGCRPQVWVDGVRDVSGQGILNHISTFDLDAVEIYRSAMEAPPEYMDPTGCGVLLFWTRRDPSGGKALSWKRVLALAGIVGLMILTLKH